MNLSTVSDLVIVRNHVWTIVNGDRRQLTKEQIRDMQAFIKFADHEVMGFAIATINGEDEEKLVKPATASESITESKTAGTSHLSRYKPNPPLKEEEVPMIKAAPLKMPNDPSDPEAPRSLSEIKKSAPKPKKDKAAMLAALMAEDPGLAVNKVK